MSCFCRTRVEEKRENAEDNIEEIEENNQVKEREREIDALK